MSSSEPHPAPCPGENVARDEAATRPVQDVMIDTPKTLPATATAADAHALFANPKVLAVPLLDGTAFAGLLEREDLPGSVAGEAAVGDYARRSVPTITPDRPMQEALDVMAQAEVVRLVVLAEDGSTLLGLLALDHDRTGFCRGS